MSRTQALALLVLALVLACHGGPHNRTAPQPEASEAPTEAVADAGPVAAIEPLDPAEFQEAEESAEPGLAALESTLRAAFAEALLEAESLGLDPSALPPLVLTDAAEIGRVLAEANRAALGRQWKDEDHGDRMAQMWGTAIAASILAKYDWTNRRVLVSPEDLKRLAGALEEPRLLERGVLRAIFVHELVHHRDELRHGLGALLSALDEPESILAMDAVLEGHAQFRTRAAAQQGGWIEDFETYTRAITVAPTSLLEELPEAMRPAIEVSYTAVQMKYEAGERFVAAVAAARGDDGVEAVLANPPAELALVLEPEWYLDPATRPAPKHNHDAVLANANEWLDARGWRSLRQRMQPAQLRAALGSLPREEVDRVLAGFAESRVIVGVNPEEPGTQFVLASMSFQSAAAAKFYEECNLRIVRERDESLTTGPIRIVAARYRDFVEQDAVFHQIEKDLEIGEDDAEPMRQTVLSVWTRQGSLFLESMWIDPNADIEVLTERVRHALAAERSRESEAPPETAQD